MGCRLDATVDLPGSWHGALVTTSSSYRQVIVCPAYRSTYPVYPRVQAINSPPPSISSSQSLNSEYTLIYASQQRVFIGGVIEVDFRDTFDISVGGRLSLVCLDHIRSISTGVCECMHLLRLGQFMVARGLFCR